MASKRRLRYKSCERKKKYESEAAAKAFIGWRRPAAFVHVYKCPFCDGYHVGRPPRPRQRRK